MVSSIAMSRESPMTYHYQLPADVGGNDIQKFSNSVKLVISISTNWGSSCIISQMKITTDL